MMNKKKKLLLKNYNVWYINEQGLANYTIYVFFCISNYKFIFFFVTYMALKILCVLFLNIYVVFRYKYSNKFEIKKIRTVLARVRCDNVKIYW